MNALRRLLALVTERRTPARRPVVEEVEPRILYSADVNPLAWNGGDPNAGAFVGSVDGTNASTMVQTVDARQQRRHEIIFVDAAVVDSQTLIDGLLATRPPGTQTEIVQLQAGSDGLRQIGDVLANERDLDAILIVSHGTAGTVQVGSTTLDQATLDARSAEFAAWRASLTDSADLLIYGCDVAATPDGQAMLTALSNLTGADVSASTDATGHRLLGGDWNLEFNVGAIETQVAPSAQAQEQWQGILAAPADDSFAGYTVGNIRGQGFGNGFTGTWSNPVILTGNVVVNATSLTYPTGGPNSAGGSAQVNANFAGTGVDQFRTLAAPMGSIDETVWISFLLQPNQVGATSFMGLAIGNSADQNLFVGYNNSDFIVQRFSGGGPTTVVAGAVSLGQTTLVVMKLDILASGNETATVYLNPTAGLAAPDVAGSATYSLEINPSGHFIDRIGISGGKTGSANTSLLDGIRLGNSYQSVVPAPVVATTGTTLAYTENAAATAIDTGLTVSDAGSATLTGATFAILAPNYVSGQDVLAFTNQLGITGNWNAGTGTLTLSGTAPLADYQTALRSITYVNTSEDPSTLTRTVRFVVSDSAGSSCAQTRNISVTAVNDAPTATNLNAAQTYTEDTPLALTAIVAADVDNATVTATLTLSNVAAGSLNTGTSGAVTSTYNAGTGVWSAIGATADVNALLAGLTFTPTLNFNGNFTIATSVSDGSLSVTGSKAITGIAVNDAPTATNLSAAETYTQNTPLNLANITVNDVESANVTATLALSNVAAGSLNIATSGSVTSTFAGGVWTASGAIADVNTLLAGLTFTPSLNFNSAFSIATSVSDGVAAPITGSKAMTSIAVNVPPTATNLSTAETYTEDTPLNLVDIVISDIDSPNVTATLTLSNAAAGSLNTATLGGVTSTFAAGVWTASGAIANVNALLAGLTFTPSANFNGNFSIATGIDDGVAAPISGTKVITGTAVNDPPIAANESYSVNEDSTLVVGPSTANLANLWGFNEGGSSQTIGSAGSLASGGTLGSTAGVDAADPTWVPGYVGGSALAFNGGGQYVDTTSTDLKTATSFTLSAWFQASTTAGTQHILWQGYPGGNGYGNGGSTTAATSEMSLSIGSYTAAYNNKIVFSLGYDVPANGADSIFIASASNFTDTGSWHNVAVVVTDIGGGVMSASLYVDGKLEGTDTGSQNDRSVWGALRVGAPGDGSRSFNGKIDEVRVYSTALAPASIQNIATAGVLGNDTDVDSATLKVNTSVVTGPANGALSINQDGSFTYTPNANFNGVDTFTYKANDGALDSNVATVTITVNAVNDAPTGASVVTGTPTEDQVLTANTGTIADADGLGAFSYQWQRNGVAVVGATSSTYTLGDTEVGTNIRVVVSYTDAQGTAESLTSAAVGPVANVNDAPTGAPVVTGTPTENQVLGVNTASIADADGLGAFSYQWQRNGVAVVGATGSTYTLGNADVGTNVRVVVFYTDGHGTAESLTSAAVGPVANVNDAPTGAPVVTGTTTENQVLTADTSSIADADGLGAFSYQWQLNGVAVAGATGSTYTLGNADVGANMRVVVSYTDGHGTAESLTSAAVGPVANVNEAPTGAPVVTGTPTEDQVLGVNTASIADADGLGAFSYQWQRNGSNIVGATTSTYTLGDADVGTNVRVVVSYTDGHGTAESLTSAAVGPIANVNDAPTGAPVVTGTTTENQTLTADTSSIADADGLGAFSYQWQRDGVAVVGATGSTYTLGNADVGANMRVVVSYTDGHGAAESLTSAAVGPVANVNDAPTGAPVVTGTTTESQVLTADTASIADADGLGAFSYQWQRNGVNVVGATSSTYTLGNADVGTNVCVVVSYTDGHGTAESLTSAAVGPVANVNDAPTGAPVVTGILAENQVLSADTSSIADADGLGAFSYQWQRNGVVVAGATGSTYTLGNADVGANMRVVVSYTDGHGTAESLTSAAVGPIANVNDAPTITSDGGGAAAALSLAENQLAVTTVTSSDVDGGAPVYSVVGGADAARFTIDAQLGTLSFVSAPDFEAPSDADGNNVYDLVVGVADGNGGTVTQAIAVTVINVNEAPGGIAPTAAGVAENAAAGTLVATVTASDPDAGDLFTFTLVNDGNGRFEVDPNSGRLLVAPGAQLNMATAPSYTLLMRVTDAGGLQTEQTIVVSLVGTSVIPGGNGTTIDPPAPAPAPAADPPPAPAPVAAAAAPATASAGEPRERSAGRVESLVRVDGDLAGPGSNDRDGSPSWLQQRLGMPRDGATPVAVSVSFGVGSSPGPDGGDRSLDALLLKTSLDGSASRGSIFGLRGGAVEAEHGDADALGASGDTARAFVAAVQDPVRVASATLTAGFVWWLTRTGGLLTSIMMGIPAWRHVDLLPVLAPRPDDDEEEADDTAVPDESRLADSVLQDSVVDEMFFNTRQQYGDSRFLR